MSILYSLKSYTNSGSTVKIFDMINYPTGFYIDNSFEKSKILLFHKGVFMLAFDKEVVDFMLVSLENKKFVY